MSRKITSFLTMLVMLFVSVNASAQAVDATEFEGKSVTIGGAVTTVETGTWYIVFNGTRANEMGAFVNKDELPGTGGVLYDNGTSKALKKNVNDISSGSPASQYLQYYVRFIDATEEGESDVYLIQFATGNYLTDALVTNANKYDGAKFNFYPVAGNQNGHFGFNLYNMGNLVNNNGVNGTLAYWKSGQITEDDYETLKTADTYNSVWSIHPVILNDIDPEDEAWQYATSVIEGENGYRAKMNEMKENVGTFPGQYDPAAVQALADAIDEYDELGNNPDYTIQGIYDAVEKIKTTYEAAVASKVPVTLADGYYRIKSGLAFYKEETVLDPETGEPMIDPETGNEKKETVYYDKYMYSQESGGSIAGKWGTPADLSTDATALWKITNKDGYFDIVNMGTDARFNNVARSTNITMSKETENLMAIDPALNVQDPAGVTTYVNIRVSTQNGGDGLYIHTGGHGSGAGISGNLVGWYTTVDGTNTAASEWLFLPVSDEEAQAVIDAYAPIKNHDVMVAKCKEMIADALPKIEIAKDIQTTVNEDNPMVTDYTQYSSPFSQNDLSSSTDGSNFDANPLNDNNIATYWHSYWGAGSVAMDTHYLQVMINDADANVANALIVISRRSVKNDHVTAFNVRGTNTADAETADCELLGSISVPFGAAGETNVHSTIFPVGGYKYLRFYPTATRSNEGTQYNNRGYFHLAEFQMYPAEQTQSETCQYNVMGEIATNLVAAIESVQATADADITAEQYNTLKAAYEAFIDKFVDPTALRNKLAETADVASIIRTGTNPGFWSEGSDASSFSSLWNQASEYDQSGNYTPRQSESYVESLSNATEEIYASTIGVEEDKWYYLRFPSEEDFTDFNWEKQAGGGDATTNDEALYGKYVMVADAEALEGGGYTINELTQEQISLGTQMHLMDEVLAMDNDMAKFRFINVGDTAYIIQNKASGLFLKAGETGAGAISLSIHPALFKADAVGYGLNKITSTNIFGKEPGALHAQRSYNVLVSWDVKDEELPYIGSRCAFYIEEAENVDADYDGTMFNMFLQAGKIYSYCFPVEVALQEDEPAATMWSISGVNVEDNMVYATLCPIEKANGGHPFFLVNGDTESYDAADTYEETVVLLHGYDISLTEPDENDTFKGTYSQKTVGAGVIVADGNELVVTKRSSTAVGANSAYITSEDGFNVEAEVEISWDGTEDGIAETISKVSKSGAVYTLDGRLVSKNANLNTLKGFGKGIYILNGVKVVVK